MKTRRVSIFGIILIVGAMVYSSPAPTVLARPKVDMSAVPPDPTNEVVNLRYVTDQIGEGFKIRRSLHYSIIYNSSEEDVAVFEYAIEKTYRACVKWSLSLGLDIHQPHQKLITHFFNDYREYEKYAAVTRGGGISPAVLGYYSPYSNYSYFYNFRNTPTFKNAKINIDRQIAQLSDGLRRGDVSSDQKKAIRKKILKLRAVQNRLNTYGGDTTEETLQHEASHQVLFNIGFHNETAALQGANPRWFAEGVAQLFEPIDVGGGSGFGKVNKTKAGLYHNLVKHHALFPIAQFVSDPKFFHIGDVGGQAYPEAWALAHYLKTTKRKELTDYINEIKERDGNYTPTPENELETFERHFGKVDDAWVERFKNFMEHVN